MATAPSMPQQAGAPVRAQQAGAPPMPPQAAAPARTMNPAPAAEAKPEQALVPSPQLPEARPGIALTGALARMPVELDVSVPVREFRVRNLLALEPGQVIETQWGHGEDMPLAAGDVQLAWSEFEVVDSLLAVRVTRVV